MNNVDKVYCFYKRHDYVAGMRNNMMKSATSKVWKIKCLH